MQWEEKILSLKDLIEKCPEGPVFLLAIVTSEKLGVCQDIVFSFLSTVECRIFCDLVLHLMHNLDS